MKHQKVNHVAKDAVKLPNKLEADENDVKIKNGKKDKRFCIFMTLYVFSAFGSVYRLSDNLKTRTYSLFNSK